MASRLLLLPVPAPDGIVQRGTLVVGKEVANILVVLEFYLEVETFFLSNIGFFFAFGFGRAGIVDLMIAVK